MRKPFMLTLVAASLAAPLAMAAEAKIDITSPADGSKVKPGMHNQLDYEVTLGGEANHAHLYVDGKMAGLLRQEKGRHMLDPLAVGVHEICAKMVNKNHTPIGLERCIKVTVE